MNYIYVYAGKIPDYIRFGINSVFSVDKNASIYFCTDQDVSFQGCTMIDLRELETSEIKYIKNNNFYKNTNYEKNPLWLSSLLRIFYLEKITELFGIDSFIHFDSDVIVYHPYEELKTLFQKDKINITQHTDNQLIFGYCFVGNINKYKLLIKEALKIVENIDSYMKMNFGNPLNEMDILGEIHKSKNHIFNLLPVLPYGDEGYVFDPASYGQYFGGTHQKPRKFLSQRIKEEHHIVGREILAKRIQPKLVKSDPKVIHNGNSSQIVNLHIHSKELHKFLPQSYKEYIK
tara:strand:+ start:22802 stop:23668 length:867 start_codon:yes stop_codon:yes gene_type:complete